MITNGTVSLPFVADSTGEPIQTLIASVKPLWCQRRVWVRVLTSGEDDAKGASPRYKILRALCWLVESLSLAVLSVGGRGRSE